MYQYRINAKNDSEDCMQPCTFLQYYNCSYFAFVLPFRYAKRINLVKENILISTMTAFAFFSAHLLNAYTNAYF